MFSSSNYFFTFNNNVYVVVFCSYIVKYLLGLFTPLLGVLPQLSFVKEWLRFLRPSLLTKSFFVFSKYNFFNSYNFKSIYIYLMKFLWVRFMMEYKFFLDFYMDLKSKDFFSDLRKVYDIRVTMILLLLKGKKFDSILKLNFIFVLLKNLVNNKLIFSFFKYVLKEEYFLLILCLDQ